MLPKWMTIVILKHYKHVYVPVTIVCSHLPHVYRSLLFAFTPRLQLTLLAFTPRLQVTSARIYPASTGHFRSHLPHVYRSLPLAFTPRLQVTSARIYPTSTGHSWSHYTHLISLLISGDPFPRVNFNQLLWYSQVTHIHSILRDTMLCDSRSATSACRYTQQSSWQWHSLELSHGMLNKLVPFGSRFFLF